MLANLFMKTCSWRRSDKLVTWCACHITVTSNVISVGTILTSVKQNWNFWTKRNCNDNRLVSELRACSHHLKRIPVQQFDNLGKNQIYLGESGKGMWNASLFSGVITWHIGRSILKRRLCDKRFAYQFTVIPMALSNLVLLFTEVS